MHLPSDLWILLLRKVYCTLLHVHFVPQKRELQLGGRWSLFIKMNPQFFPKIYVEVLQSFHLLIKQTFLQTLPSSTMGYHIPFLAHVLLAFLFLQLQRNDTIPQELIATQQWTVRCYVNSISIGFTQVFMMITKIGYKVRWKLQEDWGYENQWCKMFFNVLTFWQLANRGWDLHLTRKMTMH